MNEYITHYKQTAPEKISVPNVPPAGGVGLAGGWEGKGLRSGEETPADKR